MNPLRGIGLKVLSVCVFTAMAVCIKASAPHVPPGQAVFFRSFFAMPVILGWLAWQYDLRYGLRTGNPLGHLWRGLVGVLVVLWPNLSVRGADAANPALAVGAMAALLGAVFAALAQVFVRKLIHTEKTATIVFYFSLTATLLSLLTIPFGWVAPAPREAVLLVSAGLLGGLGQILLTESYRHAETAVIAPFEYVSMLLALVLGYTVFAEVPTRSMLIGAALIVAAGLFIIWRERRLGIERTGSRKVMTPQG